MQRSLSNLQAGTPPGIPDEVNARPEMVLGTAPRLPVHSRTERFTRSWRRTLTKRPATPVLLTCAAFGVACGSDGGFEPEQPPAVIIFTTFEVSPTLADLSTLAGANTLQLTLSARDQTGAPMPGAAATTYSSSAPSIAGVSSSGVVTGAAPGTAVIAATLTLGGITLSDAMTATVHGPSGNVARLRVVHADDELPDLDVVVGGAKVLTGLTYANASDYLQVKPDQHYVEVIARGLGWIEARDMSFTAGGSYTLVPCCALMDGFSTLLTDDTSEPAAGNAKVRVVNFARMSYADIYVTAPGADLASEAPTLRINLLDASDYIEVPAGDYQVRVTQWGSKSVVIDSGILTLGSGQVRTAVAVDTREGGGGRILVLEDSK